MIGVAFGIHETFGEARDIERVALARVASHLARTHGLDAAAIFERLAELPDATVATPGAVRDLLSAAIGPALSSRVTGDVLEGLVRSAGTRVAGERFTADPGVAHVLRALSDLNVPLAALSLGWPGVDRCKAEAAGYDGEVVYAGDLAADDGILAPFVRLTAALRLPSDQIFFVGTDARMQLHPAALAGLRTIRLDRDGAPFPAGLPPPEFTIASIDELLPILSGPYTRGLLALRDIMRSALDWREGHFVRSAADVLPQTEAADESES